nr:hypothetical protein [Paraburkholderia kururiensis]
MKTRHYVLLLAAAASGWRLALPAHAQTASAPAATLPASTVATVNGVAIPQWQLDDALRAAAQAFHQPDTPQLRQALKQQLIVRELFRQNAEKTGYGTKPEVQRAMETAKTNAET